MKITKRLGLPLALFFALAFLLSACQHASHTAGGAKTREETGDSLAPGEKIEFTLAACYADWTDLGATVAKFNQSSDRYHVSLKDYSDGGAPDVSTRDQLIMKINTEILSGNCPDMLCFDEISPLPYIRKGYLVDLKEYFAQDEEIGLEDLAVSAALERQEGVYYISDKFTYSTMAGLYANFGDRYGWTFSEYLAYEKARPAGTAVLYNETQPVFLETISQLYLPLAIDWEKGECNFASNDFISILEAAERIRETPAESLDIGSGYNETFVGTGQLIAGATGGNHVYDMALAEQRAGARLSFVGRPTVDGSCGSTVRLSYPVGIFSSGAHTEGCWEFIKFMLQNAEPDEFSMPVYLPILQAVVEDAKTNTENPVQMTDEDAERFFEMLKHIDKLYMVDETVLGIIADEGASCFSGHKTAKEAAQSIQDKVCLYLAELA